jgi:hypothetical protein
MMFDPYEITWRGATYTIPANRLLGAIAAAEEVITLAELAAAMQKNAPPLTRIARAYAAVLRYAGAKATDDEVYVGMFNDAGADVVAAVAGLLQLMMPPQANAKVRQGGDAQHRPLPTVDPAEAALAELLQPATRPPSSADVGSRQASSGA